MATGFPKIGDRFSKEVAFDAESIKRYAALAGDLNPIHHDEKFAAKSRFGCLIASGTHTSAMMMGAAASYLTELGPSLGLEASVRMRGPIRAGDTARIEWEVTGIEDKPSLKGRIITMTGQLVRADGAIALTATTKGLLLSPIAAS